MENYKLIKFIFGEEKNNDNSKTYATKEDATNAGNSWTRDCTVHEKIRESRWFEVKKITT